MKHQFFTAIHLVLTGICTGQLPCTTPIDTNPDLNMRVLTLLDTKHPPAYPGGERDLMTFIRRNLIYPDSACQDSIAGRVFVRFIVEKDGSRSDYFLCNDIGGGCGAEAIRLIKSMPKFNPGHTNGTNKRFYYYLPIRFGLQQCDPNYHPYNTHNIIANETEVDTVATSPLGRDEDIIKYLQTDRKFKKSLKKIPEKRDHIAVSFIVERNGSLTFTNHEPTPSEQFVFEAIANLGLWKPAVVLGQTVRQKVYLLVKL